MAEYIHVELNGTGAGSASAIGTHGELFSFVVSKDGMTANPAVVITDNIGRTLLTVTETGTTEYPLMLNAVDDTGALHTNIFKSTLLSGKIIVTVTGGDANGSVSVYVLAR